MVDEHKYLETFISIGRIIVLFMIMYEYIEVYAMYLSLYIWKTTIVSSGFIQLVGFLPYQKSHFGGINNIILQI